MYFITGYFLKLSNIHAVNVYIVIIIKKNVLLNNKLLKLSLRYSPVYEIGNYFLIKVYKHITS